MRTELIFRDRRLLLSDVFDQNALTLLPSTQRFILVQWLKGKSQKPKWETLLKAAIDHGSLYQVETAESLALSLVECGAATLEQRLERGVWTNTALTWTDYERLNAALGLSTISARRALLKAELDAAAEIDWQRSSLAAAYQSLAGMAPDQARARLALLIKLNDWLTAGKSGTRYAFSLFSFGQTKYEITQNEWTWLEESIGLAECGIQQHAPVLWIAGDIQLRIGERWLDIGAARDAVALTPFTLEKLVNAESQATYYRLIENRTSFEYLARSVFSNPHEIIVWLPGYAPSWWHTAVGQLLRIFPANARFSCDADPDGVQIALHAAALWESHGLKWEPHMMDAFTAAGSQHKLRMSERDYLLAQKLLTRPETPTVLAELLNWCIETGCKAEQENWIGADYSANKENLKC